MNFVVYDRFMLSRSFIILPSIGLGTERSIWHQGIFTWRDFVDTKKIKGISPLKKYIFDKHIRRAHDALMDDDASYFSTMPLPHSWRLYNEFKDDAVYLDIETADYYGHITVIGLYDGNETKMMIRGFNLNKNILEQELKKYKLIITFNGASFDLPVIRRYFGDVIPQIPHIDLRGVCSKIGLVGGLKSIEKQLGIERPEDLQHVYGDDACWLWHKFKETQDMKYLDILIRYNEEDIINLKPIAEHAVKELWKRTYSERTYVGTPITSFV
jgi:uncharacterized protein YprB with RNaseH-like and TPR domain